MPFFDFSALVRPPQGSDAMTYIVKNDQLVTPLYDIYFLVAWMRWKENLSSVKSPQTREKATAANRRVSPGAIDPGFRINSAKKYSVQSLGSWGTQ